ncbi:hypothetical protein KA005_31825, partial [bacterium]|nr:hypothetical protein [bacterium]
MTGFFTGKVEYKYPHPPFDISILLIVEEAVRQAWKKLKRCVPEELSLSSASEKEITIELLNILENLRGKHIVDGFDSKTFETVIREGNLTNYDGKHPDKEPDLVFRLHEIRAGTENVQDGIIAECKPIDIKHPVGSTYCEKGVKRFVDGDYAWAMHSG